MEAVDSLFPAWKWLMIFGSSALVFGLLIILVLVGSARMRPRYPAYPHYRENVRRA